MLADVSTMMSSELGHHFTNISFFKAVFTGVFPQLPVHPSTECMRTDTLHSYSILYLDVACHKTPSQTNNHPYIDFHSRLRKPLPTSVLTLKEGETVFVAAGEWFCPVFTLDIN